MNTFRVSNFILVKKKTYFKLPSETIRQKTQETVCFCTINNNLPTDFWPSFRHYDGKVLDILTITTCTMLEQFRRQTRKKEKEKEKKERIEKRCTMVRKLVDKSRHGRVGDKPAPLWFKSVSGDTDTRSCRDPWKGDTQTRHNSRQ